jgi:hypothetical protein
VAVVALRRRSRRRRRRHGGDRSRPSLADGWGIPNGRKRFRFLTDFFRVFSRFCFILFFIYKFEKAWHG